MDLTITLPAHTPDDHVSRWSWPRTGPRHLPGRHRYQTGRTPALTVLERERLLAATDPTLSLTPTEGSG